MFISPVAKTKTQDSRRTCSLVVDAHAETDQVYAHGSELAFGVKLAGLLLDYDFVAHVLILPRLRSRRHGSLEGAEVLQAHHQHPLGRAVLAHHYSWNLVGRIPLRLLQEGEGCDLGPPLHFPVYGRLGARQEISLLLT